MYFEDNTLTLYIHSVLPDSEKNLVTDKKSVCVLKIRKIVLVILQKKRNTSYLINMKLSIGAVELK